MFGQLEARQHLLQHIIRYRDVSQQFIQHSIRQLDVRQRLLRQRQPVVRQQFLVSVFVPALVVNTSGTNHETGAGQWTT